jgi:hypothetical protein
VLRHFPHEIEKQYLTLPYSCLAQKNFVGQIGVFLLHSSDSVAVHEPEFGLKIWLTFNT